MPELPDVEALRKYFNRTSIHRIIINVNVETEDLIHGASAEDFRKFLINREFQNASRRGKFMITNVSNSEKKVVFHFGMTGGFHYHKTGGGENRHTRIRFLFENGYELRWLNQRKLGRVFLVSDINEIETIKNMGSEPLEMERGDFLDLLQEHPRKNIKGFLMDQSIVAGIGNIYSDEILFQAGIMPIRKAGSLKKKEKRHLFEKMRYILKNSSNIKEFIIPHRHGDMKCPKCGGELKSVKIIGRTSFYCPRCQR